MKRSHFVLAVVVVVILLVFGANAGRWLLINEPQKSDVILVLAGEAQYRPARALELLRQGYSPKILLDVPGRDRIYSWTQPELAKRWVQSLPEANAITICPILGFSTKQEAREAGRGIQPLSPHRVLLVTSDFHTRRALSTFRQQFPTITFSVAAAYDASEFGVAWWKHREWAKTTLYEWMRLAWWEVVDRWR